MVQFAGIRPWYRGKGMLDELSRLRETPVLFHLLTHYAELGTIDREPWRDRLMELGDLGTRDLVRLHGELLAFGWLEQNTGHTPSPRPGNVAGCYRVTSAGLKAWKQVTREVPIEEEAIASV